MIDELFDTADAARYVGYSPTTLETWRVRGGGPPYLQRGPRGKVRYRRSDLDVFLASQRREATSDDGRELATTSA